MVCWITTSIRYFPKSIIIDFISKRITRSFTKIREFICTIDEISLKKKKPINMKIIKEILEDKLENI